MLKGLEQKDRCKTREALASGHSQADEIGKAGCPTCDESTEDRGQDRSLCSRMDMGKFPEQEPILGHGIHHPWHGEDGAYEAGREEAH